jgi:hypothetical protein
MRATGRFSLTFSSSRVSGSGRGTMKVWMLCGRGGGVAQKCGGICDAARAV